MMLLEEEDTKITEISSFEIWDSYTINILKDRLDPYGFSFKDHTTLEKPIDQRWTMERSRGQPFAYHIRGAKYQYNPHFRILWEKMVVVDIHVQVYRISTSYQLRWNEVLMKNLKSAIMVPVVMQHCLSLPWDISGHILSFFTDQTFSKSREKLI